MSAEEAGKEAQITKEVVAQMINETHMIKVVGAQVTNEVDMTEVLAQITKEIQVHMAEEAAVPEDIVLLANAALKIIPKMMTHQILPMKLLLIKNWTKIQK